MNQALSVSQKQPVTSVILKVTAGPNKGEQFKVTAPGGIIGRDPEACNIVVSDPRVSRNQCRIDFMAGNITVRDLAQKQTTLINDQIIDYATVINGDVLKIGDTQIEFSMTGGLSVVPAKPSTNTNSPQLNAPNSGSKGKLNFPRLVIIAAVLGGAVLYLLSPNKPKKPLTVASTSAAQKAIEASLQRQEEIRNARPQLKGNALYNAEKSNEHFIRGFRDFQAQKYNRAIEAFQTAVATNPNNIKARRYQKLAQKKLRDAIDYHMDLGAKYKGKNMFRLCIAEFGMVLQIINQPNDKYYKLAKEQIRECRLSKQRGF